MTFLLAKYACGSIENELQIILNTLNNMLFSLVFKIIIWNNRCFRSRPL